MLAMTLHLASHLQSSFMLSQAALFPLKADSHSFYRHHIFIIHASSSGRVHCFYILALVDNATANVECRHLSKIILIPLHRDCCTWRTAIICFNILETSLLLSIMSAPTCSRTDSAHSFSFLHILTEISEEGSDASCGLHLHTLVTSDATNSHMRISHVEVFYRETAVQFLCPFFIWSFVLCSLA